MDQGFEGPPTEFANDRCEDTVELELIGEQVLGISQAAEGAQTTAHPLGCTPRSSPREPIGERVFGLSPALRSIVIRRAARSDFVCGLTLASAVVVGMTAIVWHAADRPSPAPAVTSAALVVSPPATLAEPEERPPVQMRNPFDATEVFELPAGTSKTEAREAIAELLLQRARDRRGQELAIKYASNHHVARGAAERSTQTAQDHGRPDVFVTKLSGYPNPNSGL